MYNIISNNGIAINGVNKFLVDTEQDINGLETATGKVLLPGSTAFILQTAEWKLWTGTKWATIEPSVNPALNTMKNLFIFEGGVGAGSQAKAD